MVADIARAWSTEAVEDLVRRRRSVRHFQDTPVPRDVVAELLQQACWAPSPHNSQPWRFTVLFDRAAKARLARDMATQLRRELEADGLDAAAIERQTGRSYQRISTAPVVVLCSLHAAGLVTYPDEHRTRLEWQMAVQSVGAVLQTFFLLAAARGLGACWMAAPMYCPEVVRSAVNLPDDLHPQALVLMGYEAAPGKVRPRRDLTEVIDLR
jgi:F420 biosynthesis protein FbiB-like protein